jgi:hypothetical protein
LDFSGLQAFTQLSGVSQSVIQCKVTFSFMLALVRVSPFLSNRKITKERCNIYTSLLLNEKCVKMTRSRKKKKPWSLKKSQLWPVTTTTLRYKFSRLRRTTGEPPIRSSPTTSAVLASVLVHCVRTFPASSWLVHLIRGLTPDIFGRSHHMLAASPSRGCKAQAPPLLDRCLFRRSTLWVGN